MANMVSLKDLMQDELRDIYDAEKQLTKALPKLAKKATNEQLREAIEQHLQETEGHVERLERVFQQLGMPAKGRKCEGMQHLIDEGTTRIGDADEDATRDAVMIASAQKVEHYEIATYGTLRTWANLLGHTEAASLLEETLEEEKQADQKLTQVAESFVNAQAAEEGGEDEEETPARSRRGAGRSGAHPSAADRGRASNRGRR